MAHYVSLNCTNSFEEQSKYTYMRRQKKTHINQIQTEIVHGVSPNNDIETFIKYTY